MISKRLDYLSQVVLAAGVTDIPYLAMISLGFFPHGKIALLYPDISQFSTSNGFIH